MKIKAKSWNIYCRMSAISSIPVVMFLIFGDDKFTTKLSIAYLIFTACSGFIMALLTRLGIIEIIYSENERKNFLFKMQKIVAKKEKGIWGKLFSDRYYKTFNDNI